jgi:hypothetical protein
VNTTKPMIQGSRKMNAQRVCSEIPRRPRLGAARVAAVIATAY